MSHTNSWNESSPAGSAAASTVDDVIRQLKLDLRERLELQHYFNQALTGDTQDGIHKEVSVNPASTNLELLKTLANQVVNGSNTTSMLELGATWNTTGAPTLLKFSLTKTACDAAARLLDLLVDAASVLHIDLAGAVHGSFIGSLTGNADTVTNGVYTTGAYSNPAWITSLDYAKITGIPGGSGTTIAAGIISMYGGAVAPSGWLLCQGQSLLRADYADLFAAIGVTYGAADSSHFSLPDLQQRFALGKSGAEALGDAGGTFSHTHTGPSHTHTGPSHAHAGPSHTHTGPSHTHAYTDVLNHTHAVTVTDPGHTHSTSVTGGSSGAIASGANMAPNVDATASATTGISASTANPASGVASGTTAAGGSGNTGAGGTANTDLSGTGATGAGGTGDTGTGNPPYLVVNYIIKF